MKSKVITVSIQGEPATGKTLILNRLEKLLNECGADTNVDDEQHTIRVRVSKEALKKLAE